MNTFLPFNAMDLPRCVPPSHSLSLGFDFAPRFAARSSLRPRKRRSGAPGRRLLPASKSVLPSPKRASASKRRGKSSSRGSKRRDPDRGIRLPPSPLLRLPPFGVHVCLTPDRLSLSKPWLGRCSAPTTPRQRRTSACSARRGRSRRSENGWRNSNIRRGPAACPAAPPLPSIAACGDALGMRDIAQRLAPSTAESAVLNNCFHVLGSPRRQTSWRQLADDAEAAKRIAADTAARAAAKQAEAARLQAAVRDLFC